jgi:hypothetical protein
MKTRRQLSSILASDLRQLDKGLAVVESQLKTKTKVKAGVAGCAGKSSCKGKGGCATA